MLSFDGTVSSSVLFSSNIVLSSVIGSSSIGSVSPNASVGSSDSISVWASDTFSAITCVSGSFEPVSATVSGSLSISSGAASVILIEGGLVTSSCVIVGFVSAVFCAVFVHAVICDTVRTSTKPYAVYRSKWLCLIRYPLP